MSEIIDAITDAVDAGAGAGSEGAKGSEGAEGSGASRNKPNGVLHALHAKGIQDTYMFGDRTKEQAPPGGPVFRDMRSELLGHKHATTYCKVPVKKMVSVESNRVVLLIERSCDMINELDLAIPVGLPRIKTVSVEIGGQRIDKMDFPSDGSQTLIEALAALYRRGSTSVPYGGSQSLLVFFPLLLAPFHSWNLLPLVALQYHDVQIIVEFHPNTDPSAAAGAPAFDSIDLYGNVYYFDNDVRRRLASTAIEFGVAQCQWGNDSKPELVIEERADGRNRFAVKAYMNHPTVALIFWGFDRSLVTNVRLTLDGAVYYDGPLEALEVAKSRRFHGRHPMPDACFIFFSHADTPIWSDRQATVNFSRIDSTVLEIETTQQVLKEVHVRAVTLQPLRIMSGMAGLAFSK